MKLGLDGRVVAVAGSSRGIGLAIAAAALAEGASVVVSGRDGTTLERAAAELEERFGAERVAAVQGDLAVTGDAGRFVAAAQERWGRLDGLVLSAGSGSGRPGWDTTPGEWDESFHANLWPAARVLEAALPRLVEASSGSIVVIASIAGLEALPAPLPYGAAKASLLAYAKGLARRLGGDGIRVNAVAPGNVLFAGGTWERHLRERPEEVRAYVESEVPLNRFGTPEEVASVAVFLLSERASFVTGACVVVDGGQTRSIA